MDVPLQDTRMTAAQAKERLLGWAVAQDEQRRLRPKSPLVMAAAIGGGVLLTGLLFRRGFGSLGKIVSAAFLVRGLPWIVPLVTGVISKSIAARTK